MDKIDLDELEQLAAQATPGPWRLVDARAFLDDEDFEIRNGQHCIGYGTSGANAAYIVAACNSLPELIAENRALQERAQMRQELVEQYEQDIARLRQKVRELERQRELLAKELVCRGHILGSVADADLCKPWIDAVEQAAKEAGE